MIEICCGGLQRSPSFRDTPLGPVELVSSNESADTATAFLARFPLPEVFIVLADVSDGVDISFDPRLVDSKPDFEGVFSTEESLFLVSAPDRLPLRRTSE